MNIDEFKDFYVEGSFAVRDAEIQFKLQIGQLLVNEPDLKPFAQAIRKHQSFLQECIEVYKKWPELEKQYTKEKSWSDLVRLAGLEKEKRPRKAIKSILSERLEENKKEFEQTGDIYTKGKLDEDAELLGVEFEIPFEDGDNFDPEQAEGEAEYERRQAEAEGEETERGWRRR